MSPGSCVPRTVPVPPPALRDKFAEDPAYIDSILQRIDRAADGGRQDILDLGCGTGLVPGRLSERRPHWRFIGVDFQPKLVAYAQSLYPEITFCQRDLRVVDLGRTYDVILCLGHTLSYLLADDDLEAACRTIARHAGPGTLLVAEVLTEARISPAAVWTTRGEGGGLLTLTWSRAVNRQGFQTTSRTWELGFERLATDTVTKRAISADELSTRVKALGFLPVPTGEDGLLVYQFSG